MPATSLEEQFGLLARGGLGEERFPLYARMRQEAPVMYQGDVNAWVVTRFDDVKSVLAADTRFRPLTRGTGSAVYGRSFTQMHGQEHNKKVGIIGRRIRSAGAIVGLSPMIESVARECAAALPKGERVDLMEDYASLIPVRVLTFLFDMETTPELREIYNAIEHGGMAAIADPEARSHALEAIPRLKAVLAPLLAERRENPGNDLISEMVRAQYEGAPLPEDEVVAMVAFLLIAGVKTTERTLANMLRHLVLHPDLWRALHQARDDEGVLLSFVAESLRCFPPAAGVSREALHDTEIGTVSVAEGDRVLCLVGSANRDETHFDDAETFRYDRFLDSPERQFTNAAHILPFGAGPHFCVGARLAGAELKTSLSALLDVAATLEPAGPVPDAEGFLHYGPPRLEAVIRDA